MFYEGAKVSYVGAPVNGLAIGDRGVVLAVNGEEYGVIWHTGTRRNQVDYIHDLDLVTLAKTQEPEEAGISVRAVFDEQGPLGLLGALSDEGLLATIASDVMSTIEASIRTNPDMQQVLGQLEDHEGDQLVSLASMLLVRDMLT